MPDHELVRFIARGSYGDVWLARSVLGRLRAVKVVYRKRFSDARPYEREFSGILRVEPLSRSNEGLMDILHVGRHEPEGLFYCVMELADDAATGEPLVGKSPEAVAGYRPRTLAREIQRRGRLSFEECVQLGLKLSSALSHLHRHGLIHRDIKPANVLYVGGMPKLGDIGLVGAAGDSASYVGTGGYIPPEGPGTAQADVFGLGKVLYEAATGQDRLEFPLLPALALDEREQGRLAELNAVYLRACMPEARSRYQSAEEMHADLALLHCGQSVRKQRRTDRVGRQAGRALTAGLFVVGLGLGAWWSPRRVAGPGVTRPGTGPGRPVPHEEPVDLARFYNAALNTNWQGDFPGNDLATLPTNWHRFGPACFKAAGLIQLSGSYTQARSRLFPDAVEAIPVGRKCARLHFLHGTSWETEQGRHVGSYVVHYADGRIEEIALRYGEQFRNWWWSAKEHLDVGLAAVAWVGTNAATGPANKLSLYCLTWNNPFPDTTVASLDFVSTRSPSCPFLIAITVE